MSETSATFLLSALTGFFFLLVYIFQLVFTSAVWTWQRTLLTSSSIPSRTWGRWRWGLSRSCCAGRASSGRAARRAESTSCAATLWTPVSSAHLWLAWTTNCQAKPAQPSPDLSAGCWEQMGVAIATGLAIFFFSEKAQMIILPLKYISCDYVAFSMFTLRITVLFSILSTVFLFLPVVLEFCTNFFDFFSYFGIYALIHDINTFTYFDSWFWSYFCSSSWY